jgi:endonuclease/exonuclease/phosphatase family metal-dependent hydrolase
MGTLLNDSWSVANPGEPGPTFPSDIEVLDSPLIRIDYIFVSMLIEVLGCDIFATHFSDHLPLYCDVNLY